MNGHLTRRDFFGATGIIGFSLYFSADTEAQTHRKTNKKAPAANDIFSVIKQDHSEFLKTLNRMEHASDPRTRGQEFTFLRQSLLPHAKAEEVILFSVIQNQNTRLKAEEEHYIMERIIIDMKNTQLVDERWPAKLSVLKDILDRHLREEENSIFKMVKDFVSKNQAAEMANRFVAMKQELQGAVQ
ncbi:hemerythrin domain-containing protein [Desulfomonile tiedjei]|uniref:Hemerythrin HHE cation binding domain-containing protein n=1 Tax=Desulfomonile tiedjei (strain ATCC 49306 / DSM 6799 / DCB-1) TaxID=706587 RepID=I4CC36_DESTA|nr:hemerythrin domain-containing protein [Desulfomonile tiedjei]AFM27127.1 hemerythrin HHE cation binding domain-containing protein [Desulfomonile tiedjei DSM 6799]